MNKIPSMTILTESIRRDNQLPLKHFNKIKIHHFYQQALYQDMTSDEMSGAIKYNSLIDLYKKLISLKPDIIQGAEPYGSKNMFLLSLVAYFASKKLNVPLVFPVWENVDPKIKYNLIKRIILNYFLKKYIKHAKKIFYLNEGARKNLLKINTPKNKMIKFLWGTWGVDIGLFRPKHKTKNIKQKTILFGGRLDEAKGVQYLMPAFLEVKKQIKDAKLVMIGGGELTNWVKEFVRINQLTKDVTFTGIIKTKDLPWFLNQAQVFTCPSISLSWWQEQVGMINLQAMSSGVPVVSTISGGIPEYVPDDQAGILVPERDAQRLAQALIKLLSDSELRNQMSNYARNYALKHYDDKTNILKAQEILLGLLNDKIS